MATKRNKLDPAEEKNAQMLQDKCAALEQAYSALRSDSKALKVG
jgi:hypothetical protein